MGGTCAPTAASRLHNLVLPKLGISTDQIAELRPDPVKLPGRSVVLRPLTHEDWDVRTELVQRNRADLLDGGLLQEDVEGESLAATITAEACDLGYVFGIIRDEQLIGEARLTGVVRGNRQTAFLSLWVDADARGSGVAEEAFVLLVGHAVEGLELHRVEVAVLPENKPVRRALEKVGVVPRGTEPSFLKISGEWRDHERYAFTADDWADRGEELRREFTV